MDPSPSGPPAHLPLPPPLSPTALNFHQDHRHKGEIKSNEPTDFSDTHFPPLPPLSFPSNPNTPFSSSPQDPRDPKAMDWYSWLRKSGLEPGLVYEYSLLFSGNELEHDDIAYFNHEFLQSMGVSVAKHRLEILKLAKKERPRSPRPLGRLLAAINKTKRLLARYIHSFAHRDEAAIVVVPPTPASSYGSGSRRWKGAMLKRNKGLVFLKEGRPLMLTGGGRRVAAPPASVVPRRGEKGGDGDGDGFWGSGAEEIRWDSMFQNLKPT